MSVHESSSKLSALRHPLAAISFYMGNKTPMHEAIILDSATYLWEDQVQQKLWKQALKELATNDLVPPTENPQNIPVGNSLNTTFGKWIYCTVRVLQPEVMIETGVAHGSSTWIILNAMHKNKKGQLYSIDLPNNDTNAAYNFGTKQPETGWRVPSSLRGRWELHLGFAQEILPALLDKLKLIDFFFHDSDHSYGHMMYEFNTIYPYLKNGGVILSDDVHKNEAFNQFTAGHKLKALQFNKGGCAIK